MNSAYIFIAILAFFAYTNSNEGTPYGYFLSGMCTAAAIKLLLEEFQKWLSTR